MNNLIAFLVKYYHWLLFLVLEVASAVLLFRFNSYQGSVWFTSANYVAGKVYEQEAAVTQYFALTTVNEELSLRNFYMERQLGQLRRLYAEATDTTAKERSEQQILEHYKVIPAKVVSNSVNQPDNLITIDKGLKDGVEKDMGVVCGNGVVGVVYLTSDHYSILIPVLNATASRISCAIRNRGYFGYLHWNGGDPSIAYLEDIPRHAKFNRGEWIETSGYSSIFPPGVLVGKIGTVYNSRDGLSYRLKIHLSTDFSNLRDVFVISDYTMKERVKLQTAARDSMKAKRE